jgi:hypothetical protein
VVTLLNKYTFVLLNNDKQFLEDKKDGRRRLQA